MKNSFIAIISLYLSSSCSNKYYSEQDFYSTQKIDSHVHVRTTNDSIANLAKADNFQLITYYRFVSAQTLLILGK